MFGIFSKKAKQRKQLNRSHIKSLWEVVMADGKVHEDELKLIYSLGAELKISKREIDKIKDEGENIPFMIPEN